MDPFVLIKPVLMALAWWRARIGTKSLVALTVLSTIAVAIAGCHETYG